METYICNNCGYVYDPAVGESRSKTDPGIPFETLPDDWTCPKCQSPKTDFDLENGPMPGMVVPVGE